MLTLAQETVVEMYNLVNAKWWVDIILEEDELPVITRLLLLHTSKHSFSSKFAV